MKLISKVYTILLTCFMVIILAIRTFTPYKVSSISLIQLCVLLFLIILQVISLFISQNNFLFIFSILSIVCVCNFIDNYIIQVIIIFLYLATYVFACMNKPMKIIGSVLCVGLICLTFVFENVTSGMENSTDIVCDETYLSEDKCHIVHAQILKHTIGYSSDYYLNVQLETNRTINFGILSLSKIGEVLVSEHFAEQVPDIDVEWENNDIIYINGKEYNLS